MLKQHEALLRAAARDSIARIRRDHKRAPKKLKPLLAFIEAHLFDRQITVRDMMRECKIHDKGVSTLFHQEIRKPPWKYTCRRRLETAANLLRDTNLLVWQIAGLVGYGTDRNLNRAFKKRYKIPPRTYRRRARLAAVGIKVADEKHTVDDLQRALDGELEWPKASVLLLRLQKIYKLRSLKAPDAEQLMAERIWQYIRDLPLPEQQRIVRAQVGFTTPALFHLLRRNSRIEGRDNRKRGVQLAELALDALEACRSALGDEVHDLEALGCAWLANARRLALDFSGAEEAFEQAEEAWGAERQERDRLVEGEIYYLKACLRWSQRQLDDALECQGHGLKIFRSLKNHELEVQSLILRAAINESAGGSDSVIGDLTEASKLVQQLADPYLTLTVTHNLAHAYAEAGLFEEAAEIMPEAKELCRKLGNKVLRCHLLWVEGLVAQGFGVLALAEERFRQARRGFLALGEVINAALASLHLAMLYSKQARQAEVLPVVASIVPVFEAGGLHREGLAAIEVLRKACEAERVTFKMLDNVRRELETFRRDPLANL